MNEEVTRKVVQLELTQKQFRLLEGIVDFVSDPNSEFLLSLKAEDEEDFEDLVRELDNLH